MKNDLIDSIDTYINGIELARCTSLEHVKAIQSYLISSLILQSIESVPFYKNFSQSIKLKDLPIVTKETIQSNPDMFKSTIQVENSYEVSSSGSTGRPLTVLKTEEQTLVEQAEFLHECLINKIDLNSKYAVIRAGAKKENHDYWTFVHPAIKTGPSCHLSSSTDIKSQLIWLKEQKPRYLLTHPSNLKELIKMSSMFGHEWLNPISLDIVRTIGEPVTNELREMVRESWGIKIIDLYSSRECGRIAFQCPAGNGKYHVQADNVFVEVLNENNEDCKPGEIGKIAITVIGSELMPLIRYENGDYAEVGEPCECECHFMTLNRIIGRERNMITLPNGTKHWPSFPSEEWIAIEPTIKQFRIIQHTVEGIEIQLVCDRQLTFAQEDRLCLMLNRRFGGDFIYSFSYPILIETGPNGKFEDFISHVKG